MVAFEVDSPEQLGRVLGAAWDGAGQPTLVPNIAPASLPEGMGDLEPNERKRVFFRAILPHVLDVNREIRREREVVKAALQLLGSGGAIATTQQEELRRLAKKYRLASWGEGVEADQEDALGDLLERVDVIPPSLALAQAAMESAWGASRFVVEGNALFGQWVFSANQGMAPQERPAGAEYSVRRFGGLRASVAAYMRNLNSSWAYAEFREQRSRMRRGSGRLDALGLAKELLMYSQRRQAYVDEIRQIIRANQLTRFDETRIGALGGRQLLDSLQHASETAALFPVGAHHPDA